MATLPTLYEHYTAGGISSGLSTDQTYFTLNGRNITLYSGAMHYFRVPKPYWRDRLRKMRAAGLNTVETYVPWNLHEPEIDHYDFGQGGSDFDEFLDIVTFLKTAQEEDLLAIVRPGPYICSEWEFGGLPSWLLRTKDLIVRSSDANYLKYVSKYYNVLLQLLVMLQFTLGGPVIGFQIENEYGSTNQPGVFTPDKVYLEHLRQLFLSNGIKELLFTSDGAGNGDIGTLKDHLFMTANFASDPEWNFSRLKQDQPNKPVMSMEFWTGWFDHWSEEHNTRDNNDFYDVLDRIFRYPASVNMYMFHGGTNWGFLNGANVNWGTMNEAIMHDTTSYDYDAPLSEAGDYTEKYDIVKDLINQYNEVPTKLPTQPPISEKVAYSSISVNSYLLLKDIAGRIPYSFEYDHPIPIEDLPINHNSGQSYGYTIHRKVGLDIPANSILKIEGHICDTVMVLIDGELISKILSGPSDLDGFGYWRIESGTLDLGSVNRFNSTLELVSENWGRNNFGYIEQFSQFKGLWQGKILLNDEVLSNWQMKPLEFKKKWTNSLHGWTTLRDNELIGPTLYQGTLVVSNPKDTFVDMRKWNKGIVIINGFVLGRYASKLGPQQTLYLPAPLLKEGVNNILVFEHFIGDLNSPKVKGECGIVGVFGGHPAYAGSTYFASIASLKVGVDMVFVFTTIEAGDVKVYAPDLIVQSIINTDQFLSDIEKWIKMLDVIVVGPGLIRQDKNMELFVSIINNCRKLKKGVVVDSSGLNFLTKNLMLIKDYPKPGVILTPNKEEFANLFSKPNNLTTVEKLGDNVTVLRKGEIDEVMTSKGIVKLLKGGSNRRCMGQGDFLAGAVGAFFAWSIKYNGVDLTESDRSLAACFGGSLLTKECNARAFAKYGRAMLTSDMIVEISKAFKDLFE
ncbi:hypothetical protein FQA39_LY00760 [Lamprigera yunnana]|nr:hypothetical protein FQA39_LY00760 [Lamprigera yunnana]